MNESRLQQNTPVPPVEETVPPVRLWDTEDEFVEHIIYTGYEVVRREYFAHLREPSIVLADYKIKLNAASLPWPLEKRLKSSSTLAQTWEPSSSSSSITGSPFSSKSGSPVSSSTACAAFAS